MADYKGMYTHLFNKTTDAIALLQAAQTETEDMYISKEDPELIVLDHPNGEK